MTSVQNAEKIAALTSTCNRFRESVSQASFEIVSQESRVANNIHELGASMEDVQRLEAEVKDVIGATALEPLGRRHPAIATHLESRCRFLMIVGMKAISGRDMVSPESLAVMSLMFVFVVRSVFNTLREPHGVACKFLELRKFRETIGLEYFPSPLASWRMGLRTDAVIDKNKRTLLDASSRDAKSYVVDAHKLKPSDDELKTGVDVIRAILQLRPLNQFLPAGYIAEKCGMRYPSIPSMVERSEKLKVIAEEVCPNGPRIDVNALEEVASLKFSEKDGRTYSGWEAYLRSIAHQYPDMPTVVDDLLAWESSRPWMARDGKGDIVVSESHGWTYVPMRGKENINAMDETRVHGTQFNCLWSILAQGGLVGRYYNDAGIESHAVWTSEMVTESIGYSSWVYVGSGFWVTVMIHIADCDVEASGCEVVRKLGSSKKQVARKTPFLPLCGVSFRVADFDRIVEEHGGKILNFSYLSREIKPNQWSDAHSWHSLFEVSPIDFKSIACRGMIDDLKLAIICSVEGW